MTPGRIALCIPTKNAGPQFAELFRALQRQTLKIDHVLVIDSNSTDGTVEVAREFGAQIRVIAAETFNHGGTRNLARRWVEADLYVFLTQDVLPADQYTLENLVRPFREFSELAMTYARQLPRPGSSPIEAFSRFFSYPSQSQLRKKSDADRLGIKTVACSNACAAYRREALDEAGGFPMDVIMCEDVYTAAKMLDLGYALYYAADAEIYHSHDYTIAQEFKRYFDIGVFYESRTDWIVKTYGKTRQKGRQFFLEGIKYVKDNGHSRLIPEWCARSLLKYVSYHLGAKERFLPQYLKKCLSMHKNFWK
jgi:polysaccharide biosynthesis protein PslC